VEHLLRELVNFSDLVKIDTNYKDQLLRFYATRFHRIYPKYCELETPRPSSDGPGMTGVFRMGVLSPDENEIVAVAEHRNKRQAEQLASRLALVYYGAIDMFAVTE
jgi:hypothetical protein